MTSREDAAAWEAEWGEAGPLKRLALGVTWGAIVFGVDLLAAALVAWVGGIPVRWALAAVVVARYARSAVSLRPPWARG